MTRSDPPRPSDSQTGTPPRPAAAAFAAHVAAWNAGNRETWLALFSDTVTLEDPVGGLPKQGRGALETTWARSHRPGRSWQLAPRRVVACGDEVAIDLVNQGTLDGRRVTVESFEIWRVGPDGLVVSVRTFFEADPAVHDPYYLPADQDKA